MITRRQTLSGMGLIALAATGAARGQSLPKIGWLKIQGLNHTPSHLAAFVRGLNTYGLKEGRHYSLLARHADGDLAKLPQLVEALAAADVRVIVATSQPCVDVTRRIAPNLAVIGRMTDDPIRNGIAQSLSQPTGNVTGIYSLLEEMSPKRLALLHDAVPGLRRVGVLLDPTRGATQRWLEETQKVATTLGISLAALPTRTAEELQASIDGARAKGIEALLVFRNPVLVTHDRMVIEFANRHRLPTIFDAREFVAAGGMLAYGPNLDSIFERLAFQVERFLSGRPIREIPIEQPTRFELIVNLTTARSLGLTLPNTLLAGANEVIE